ncbi:hypothetical protein [Kribbella catacumbae]|uniref:hypothetical protein n=1 Tax=Kribbella catacumbae TaxID=460086 RepID=UPI0003672E71|nr:hypothetical protein [Kribbella catacumbae]
MKVRVLSTMFAVLLVLLGFPATAQADRPPFVFPDGCCYLDGVVVRTVVPPAATPDDGRDNFYAVMGGVEAQKGVVGVGPGSAGYHGGDWKFFAVTWNVTPYLLTSEAAVLAAAAAGHVTITRVAENDFKCPIQR